MVGTWLLAVGLAVAGNVPESRPEFTDSNRGGLFGWGLGLEIPMVGVMGGGAEKSRLGWGHAWGASLSREMAPNIFLRLAFIRGHTYAGRGKIKYLVNVQTDERGQLRQDSVWNDSELMIGLFYLFRMDKRVWAPYVGMDVGVLRAGYDFMFDESAAGLVSLPYAEVETPCTQDRCNRTMHTGVAWGWRFSGRGGMRWQLAPWLSSGVDLSVGYTKTGNQPISNTVLNRDLRTVAEKILTVRSLFAFQVAL